MNWCGTDITELINDKKTLIREAVYKKNTYWVIQWKEDNEVYTDVTCIVRNSTSILPCIIDEIKPVFNLEKIGTHWCKFKGKTLIFYKIQMENGNILEDITLDNIGYKVQLEPDVQKIFVFRELLGMSKNFESSIILRKRDYFFKVMSFYEPNMTPGDTKNVLPNTILNKWFKNTDIDTVVLKMFNVDNPENIISVLLDLKSKLDKIAERVNKDAITYIDEIIARIRSRLQFILA